MPYLPSLHGNLGFGVSYVLTQVSLMWWKPDTISRFASNPLHFGGLALREEINHPVASILGISARNDADAT